MARARAFPTFSPVQWTVVAIASGGGADGAGDCPHPCPGKAIPV